ncbi:MAG: hypothetical protein J6K25_04715 [Thermoguttaceae bacterium]|nr:hypothetical protein [Thermoguttaceae bacterium]
MGEDDIDFSKFSIIPPIQEVSFGEVPYDDEYKEYLGRVKSVSVECETKPFEEPQLDTLEAKEFQIMLVPNGYDVSKRFWTLEGFSSDGSETITASIRVMRPGKSCKLIKIAGRKHKASEVRWAYYSLRWFNGYAKAERILGTEVADRLDRLPSSVEEYYTKPQELGNGSRVSTFFYLVKLPTTGWYVCGQFVLPKKYAKKEHMKFERRGECALERYYVRCTYKDDWE